MITICLEIFATFNATFTTDTVNGIGLPYTFKIKCYNGGLFSIQCGPGPGDGKTGLKNVKLLISILKN